MGGNAENSVEHSVSKQENESKPKSILPWFLELLLPVIGGLKIDQIKYLLPTLIDRGEELYNENLVQNILSPKGPFTPKALLVALHEIATSTSKNTSSNVSSNTSIMGSRKETPIDLLQSIYPPGLVTSVSEKQLIHAVNLTIQLKTGDADIFRSPSLAACLGELLLQKDKKEITAIPWWYIRTLISCLQKYNHEAKMKELRREEEQGIHLVVDRILPELFRRKVWEQKNVWTGILKVVKSFLHIDLVRKSPQLLDALLTIPSKPFLQQLCKEAMSNKNISYEKILIEHKKSKK